MRDLNSFCNLYINCASCLQLSLEKRYRDEPRLSLTLWITSLVLVVEVLALWLLEELSNNLQCLPIVMEQEAEIYEVIF